MVVLGKELPGIFACLLSGRPMKIIILTYFVMTQITYGK